MGSAFEPQVQEEVVINLGVATDLDFIVRALNVEVTVTAPASDAVFSSGRTGAATSISREALATLPTISGRLESVTRLSPQAGANMQFAGQDNRLNNITVDGSYFNNSFGLAGTPESARASRRSRWPPSSRCRSTWRRSTSDRATSSVQE